MVQSGVAADFLSGDRFSDQGLLARFLLSAPAGRAGTRFRDDDAYRRATVAAAIDLADYNAAITRLLQLRPNRRCTRPHVEFYNDLEADIALDRPFAPAKAFASKLPGNVVRIAGTMELIADAGAASLGYGSLSFAIRLRRYYLFETMRLIAAGLPAPRCLR